MDTESRGLSSESIRNSGLLLQVSGGTKVEKFVTSIPNTKKKKKRREEKENRSRKGKITNGK